MSKGEVTRQRIVAEAATLFNQRGYAGCSMRDVMDATGLEKGGLYRHFACKEELAAEAFRYALAEVKRVRWQGGEEVSGVMEWLRGEIKRFVDRRGSVPGGCPLMNTAIDADDGNPVLRQLAHDAIQEWKVRLCSVVSEGIERGEIERNTDPRRIATTIIAMLEGALMISRIEGSRAALVDAQATLESLLEGIAVDRKRQSGEGRLGAEG